MSGFRYNKTETELARVCVCVIDFLLKKGNLLAAGTLISLLGKSITRSIEGVNRFNAIADYST